MTYDLPVLPDFSLPGLTSQRRLHWQIADLALVVQLIDYDSAGLTEDAFRATGIALPAAIARSVRARQASYLFGRLAARAALRSAGLMLRGIDVDIGTGDQGEPLWPEGVVASISHHAWRAAAVALPAPPWRGIGIDIEVPADAGACRDIAAVALDNGEHLLIKSLAMSPAQAYALAFSVKESFYKAVHHAVGRFFGFEAIRLRQVDLLRGTVSFDVCQDLCPGWHQGASGTAHFQCLADGDVLTTFVW